VNDNYHPNIAASYDEELAQLKRKCDKLKEALTFEKINGEKLVQILSQVRNAISGFMRN